MVANLKLWKRTTKSKQSQSPVENTSSIDVETLGPAVELHTDAAAGSDVPETFKEHYPLLLPFSYAAIVEDEKNEVKYTLLEPTLTDLDKHLLSELKNILWDELTINTKIFKNERGSRRVLKI